jgi:hypothetical protein
MISIDVKIVRVDDPPPWGERMSMSPTAPLMANEAWQLVVLERGTNEGKPSVALWLDTDQGPVIAQTTLNAWIAATCALRGAFPSAFAGTPLE